MDNYAAANAYKQNAVENAPPIKIVRMLYSGAIRFIDQASEQDPSDPKSRFNQLVHAADRIVSELRLALDFDQGDDVGDNLERLYLFVENCLGQATLDRSTAPLQKARPILVTLLEAWNAVEIQTDRVPS
jgi:flagellar secretion chaperone FliS